MDKMMDKIASFTIDHLKLLPGIYVSRKDQAGDSLITTFDIRMTRPNYEPVLNTAEIHTIEHLGATYLRNHDSMKDHVIYFGPMGCRTGFYLLVRSMTPQEVHDLIVETLEAIVAYNGPMPGAARKECGNFKCLSLADAKAECAAYLPVAAAQPLDFAYPKGADLT